MQMGNFGRNSASLMNSESILVNYKERKSRFLICFQCIGNLVAISIPISSKNFEIRLRLVFQHAGWV